MAGEKGTTSVDTDEALKENVADPDQIRAERMAKRHAALAARPGCLKAIDQRIRCFCQACIADAKAAKKKAKLAKKARKQ